MVDSLASGCMMGILSGDFCRIFRNSFPFGKNVKVLLGGFLLGSIGGYAKEESPN